MMTDYYVRDLYEKTMDRAKKIYATGADAENRNQKKAAKDSYEMAQARFNDCYELGKMYDDRGCMKESKEWQNKTQAAIVRVAGKEMAS